MSKLPTPNFQHRTIQPSTGEHDARPSIGSDTSSSLSCLAPRAAACAPPNPGGGRQAAILPLFPSRHPRNRKAIGNHLARYERFCRSNKSGSVLTLLSARHSSKILAECILAYRHPLHTQTSRSAQSGKLCLGVVCITGYFWFPQIAWRTTPKPGG